MVQPPHSKIITASARRILKPIGLFQKGRSRTWIDDHGWWLVVVEFQPSSWDRGSYLNVAAMWLWYDKDYISFDVGNRGSSFVSYENDVQFSVEAERLAGDAADRVLSFRSMFGTVATVAQHYLAQSDLGLWGLFHAGVACGLCGDTANAARFFDRLAGSEASYDWDQKLVSLANNYQLIVKDRDQFRATIKNVVRNAREHLGLPQLAEIDFA